MSVYRTQEKVLGFGCRQFNLVAEPDARLGLVAVQLGQVEEAKKLFTSAARPDLLNKLLQVRL